MNYSFKSLYTTLIGVYSNKNLQRWHIKVQHQWFVKTTHLLKASEKLSTK